RSCRKHRRVGGCDEGLSGGSHTGREDPAAARIELREHVVEKKQRRHTRPVGNRVRLSEQDSEQSKSLLPLRAEAPQVGAAGKKYDVVEVRPERGHAAFEVTLEDSGQRLQRRRLAVVPEGNIAEGELG